MTAPAKPRSKAAAASRKRAARRPARSVVTIRITLRDVVVFVTGFLGAYFLARLPEQGKGFTLIVLGLGLVLACAAYLRPTTPEAAPEPPTRKTRRPAPAAEQAPAKTLEDPA